VFPTSDIGDDPVAIRDFAQGVEELGLDHLVAYDHVLGAEHADRDPPLTGPYTEHDAFHEPFVLFGYLAAVTRRLELVVGVLVLPQRQTALVAKQAAAVDVLSAGRLRLGVGVGWNAVEFEALNESFSNRGKRVEEQLRLMRSLWTKELVTFQGHWHRVSDAGINPLPVQRPIPIWMGGESEPVVRRAARLADGWMPHFRPGPEAQAVVDRLHGLVREAGRDPATFGIEGRMTLAQVPPEQRGREMEAWGKMSGITHLCVHTAGLGLTTPAEHVRALEQLRKDVLS
jgi:probable F420-dependent oxidoreductase